MHLHCQYIYGANVTLGDAIKKAIAAASRGSIRRICTNLEQVAEFVAIRGLLEADLDHWKGRNFFGGIAPQPRRRPAPQPALGAGVLRAVRRQQAQVLDVNPNVRPARRLEKPIRRDVRLWRSHARTAGVSVCGVTECADSALCKVTPMTNSCHSDRTRRFRDESERRNCRFLAACAQHKNNAAA